MPRGGGAGASPDASSVPGGGGPGSSTVSRWRWLGRLLPRDVRERVFEPAFADLTYGWLTAADRRVHFGVRAIATFVGCVRIAIPRVIVRDGRLTRFGKVVVWGGAAIVLVMLVVANLTEGYVAYGNS